MERLANKKKVRFELYKKDLDAFEGSNFKNLQKYIEALNNGFFLKKTDLAAEIAQAFIVCINSNYNRSTTEFEIKVSEIMNNISHE